MNKVTRGKPEPFPPSKHSELLIWAPSRCGPIGARPGCGEGPRCDRSAWAQPLSDPHRPSPAGKLKSYCRPSFQQNFP